MRTILVVILIALVGVLGTTYWFGVEVERSYGSAMTEIGKSRGVRVIRHSFDRGVLSSVAETELEFGSRGYGFRIVSKDRIIHGPFAIGGLIGGDSGLALTQALIKSEVRFKGFTGTGSGIPGPLEKLPPLEFNSELLISGGLVTTLEIEPVTRSYGEGLDLDFKGFRGEFRLGADGNTVFAKFDAPLVDLKAPEAHVTMTGFRASFEFNGWLPTLYTPLGSSESVVKKLLVKTNDESIELDDVVVTSLTKENAGSLAHNQKFSLRRLVVDGREYGPGSVGIAISNLDVQALTTLKEAFYEIESRRGIGDDERDRLMMFKTLELMPELLKRAPEFEIKGLSFRTPDGETRGSFKVYVDNTDPEALGSIFKLSSAVNAELGFSMPTATLKSIMRVATKKDIARERENAGERPLNNEELEVMAEKQVAGRIEELLDLGLLVAKDKRYSFNASYKSGDLLVNGGPMPLIPSIPFP